MPPDIVAPDLTVSVDHPKNWPPKPMQNPRIPPAIAPPKALPIPTQPARQRKPQTTPAFCLVLKSSKVVTTLLGIIFTSPFFRYFDLAAIDKFLFAGLLESVRLVTHVIYIFAILRPVLCDLFRQSARSRICPLPPWSDVPTDLHQFSVQTTSQHQGIQDVEHGPAIFYHACECLPFLPLKRTGEGQHLI